MSSRPPSEVAMIGPPFYVLNQASGTVQEVEQPTQAELKQRFERQQHAKMPPRASQPPKKPRCTKYAFEGISEHVLNAASRKFLVQLCKMQLLPYDFDATITWHSIELYDAGEYVPQAGDAVHIVIPAESQTRTVTLYWSDHGNWVKKGNKVRSFQFDLEGQTSGAVDGMPFAADMDGRSGHLVFLRM